MTSLSLIDNTFSSVKAWLAEQREQRERLRPLLAAAGVVLFVGLLVGAIGLATDQLNRLRMAQVELAKLRQQIAEGSWSERQQQSEALRFQLVERFWTAETPGLAEASLERWLRERIEGQGARPDSIRVQRSSVSSAQGRDANTPLSGAQRMTAKVIMPFAPEALAMILNATATSDKILVVDRLLIRSGRNALIEMDVSTFVRLSETAQ